MNTWTHSMQGECTGANSYGYHGNTLHSYAQVSVKATGGNETRPRCVIVNTYIKVSRTGETQETQKIGQLVIRILSQFFQFDEAIAEGWHL